MSWPGVVGLAALATTLAVPPPVEKVVFVYARSEGDIAVLQPMIPPRLGVRVVSGSKAWAQGEALLCRAEQESQPIVVDGQPATLNQAVL